VCEGVHIVRLNESYLEQLLTLQESVCTLLEVPELYFPVSRQEMKEFFGSGGLCFGAKCGSQMVGFFGLLFMGDRRDNVALDLDLSSNEMHHVAYFKAVNVLPQYRGLGLQKRLTQSLFEHIGAVATPEMVGAGVKSSIEPLIEPYLPYLHSSRVLCATVSPRNLSSLKSFLDCGFWIAGLKPKYGGYQRYLIMRRRQNVTYHAAETYFAHPEEYEIQKGLLGSGMLGMKLCTDHTGAPIIKYVRPVEQHRSTTP
jgi:ribosomal protein S18 acetylase RimI-like enzyme